MQPLRHHRIVADGVALHYVTAGEGQPVVLLHGFPQTWHAWREVIRGLDGFRIIAPDLRGIGTAPGPALGYDKFTMAADIRAIVEIEGGGSAPIVVGHDIGAFVGLAYALRYRAETAALIVADAPLPGTALFDAVRTLPRVWHITFHGARDVAEMLLLGREHAYVRQFVLSRLVDQAAIAEADIDLYAAAHAAPGAMRAALEMYRAFDRDVQDSRAALATGKLAIPVAALGSAAAFDDAGLTAMLSEVAEDVTGIAIPDCGHWIPEERPDMIVECVRVMAAGAAKRGVRA